MHTINGVLHAYGRGDEPCLWKKEDNYGRRDCSHGLPEAKRRVE